MNACIDLHNPDRFPINPAGIKRAASAVLDAHPGHRCSSLSIVLADAQKVASLNASYRGVNAPTDVLAFPACAPPDKIGADGNYLGDIVIAHDYVSAQMEALDALLHDVLCLLVAHGTLHLLGYRHDSAAAKEEMWKAQERALRAAGIGPDIVVKYEHIESD